MVKTPYLEEILFQHVEEATFLWLIRDRMLKGSPTPFARISEQDEVLNAHLEGMSLAGEAAWDLCKSLLDDGPDPGSVFASTFLAITNNQADHFQFLLDLALPEREVARGLVSALGWIEWSKTEGFVDQLLASPSPDLQHVGISASAIHRKDPGTHLTKAAESPSPILQARCLRAIGELGKKDLLDLLQAHYRNEHPDTRFWACWSGGLLGDIHSITPLKAFAFSASPFGSQAMRIAVPIMEMENALQWQYELAARPETLRLAIEAAGIIGSPAKVPWLLEHLQTPALARIAFDAFSQIVGPEKAHTGGKPTDLQSEPTEDQEDDETPQDQDDDLSWPDSDRVKTWWEERGPGFTPGTRYFLGRPLQLDHLQNIIRQGMQTHRKRAALEKALLTPGKPLFEVRAPAFRQSHLLSASVTSQEVRSSQKPYDWIEEMMRQLKCTAKS